MYNNLEIENGQEQRCKFYVVKSLLGGWKLGGWVDGWKSGFKDCLQQSINNNRGQFYKKHYYIWVISKIVNFEYKIS